MNDKRKPSFQSAGKTFQERSVGKSTEKNQLKIDRTLMINLMEIETKNLVFLVINKK